MASQFHSGIDDLANEAEISNLRKEVAQIDNKSAYSSELEEIKSLENELNVKSLKNDFNELNDLKSTKPKKKIKNK